MSGAASGYRRIYSVVSRIPRGRVATYGQVARLAGLPGQARLVDHLTRTEVTEHDVLVVRSFVPALAPLIRNAGAVAADLGGGRAGPLQATGELETGPMR